MRPVTGLMVAAMLAVAPAPADAQAERPRIAFASVLTYRASAHHFRQASNNRRVARDYGYASQ